MEIKDRFSCTQFSGAFFGLVVTYRCGLAYWKSYWKNLPLSRNSSQVEKKRPDREGVLWKNCSKRSGENCIVCINVVFYNIMHCTLWSQSFVQESCTHACTTQLNSLALLGVILTFGDHEFPWITQLQLTNLQDRACSIELADSGLNFPLVESILLPALNHGCFGIIHYFLNTCWLKPSTSQTPKRAERAR